MQGPQPGHKAGAATQQRVHGVLLPLTPSAQRRQVQRTVERRHASWEVSVATSLLTHPLTHLVTPASVLGNPAPWASGCARKPITLGRQVYFPPPPPPPPKQTKSCMKPCLLTHSPTHSPSLSTNILAVNSPRRVRAYSTREGSAKVYSMATVTCCGSQRRTRRRSISESSGTDT